MLSLRKCFVVFFLSGLVLWPTTAGWCGDDESTAGTIRKEQPEWFSVEPLLLFFQKHLSPVDGSRCSMYPTCSQYSLEAFQKHGPALGWIMTCDRLLRCGRDEWRVSAPIVLDGSVRCHDPVKNNDFWWSK